MKTKLSYVIISVLMLFLFGCNDDKSLTETESELTLVGTWKLTKMSYEYQGETETFIESQIDSMGLVWTFKIEDDGTLEMSGNIDGELFTSPGTWSSSGNQFTMILTEPDGSELSTTVFEYVIDGNILKLNWEVPSGEKYYMELKKQ